MIRIVGAVSDLQQPPCPDFSRRRYSIDQIEIYIPFVPIYDPKFDFSPQLASFVPIYGTSHDLSNLAFERIPLRQSRARLYGRWSVAWPDPADRAARRTLRRARAIRDCASVKYSFPNGVTIDRLLPRLTIVASALNANNQAGARIAAVHLQIPNLPSLAARDAMIAEDAMITYARDGGGASDWNPDLHPRTGAPPNSGWFATTGGHREEPGQDESSSSQSRLRIAANEDGSRRTDVTSSADDQQTLQPGNPIDEPANLTDRPDWNHFWSDTWPAIKDWLEEPVPEYDIESGQAVGERPRWRAIAPYLGIPAATAAAFGIEAFAPTVAAWFGLHAPEASIIANSGRTDRHSVDRDQGRGICQRNQTATNTGRGSQNFRKGIDIDYRIENKDKSPNLEVIQTNHSALRFGTE